MFNMGRMRGSVFFVCYFMRHTSNGDVINNVIWFSGATLSVRNVVIISY